MPITKTVRVILTAAAEHSSHIASCPEKLPAAAQRAVAQSMLRAGQVEEVPTEHGQHTWRTADDGQRFSLRVTQVGLDAVGVAGVRAASTAFAARPLSVRVAALALLTAWDSADRLELTEAVEMLRACCGLRRGGPPTARQPRMDTKRAAVIALLRRSEGATVAQVMEATGWARHTVHGFFAGLRKQQIRVEVLDRVRQVGAGQGTAGSYTVYQVAA